MMKCTRVSSRRIKNLGWAYAAQPKQSHKRNPLSLWHTRGSPAQSGTNQTIGLVEVENSTPAAIEAASGVIGVCSAANNNISPSGYSQSVVVSAGFAIGNGHLRISSGCIVRLQAICG